MERQKTKTRATNLLCNPKLPIDRASRMRENGIKRGRVASSSNCSYRRREKSKKTIFRNIITFMSHCTKLIDTNTCDQKNGKV